MCTYQLKVGPAGRWVYALVEGGAGWSVGVPWEEGEGIRRWVIRSVSCDEHARTALGAVRAVSSFVSAFAG